MHAVHLHEKRARRLGKAHFILRPKIHASCLQKPEFISVGHWHFKPVCRHLATSCDKSKCTASWMYITHHECMRVHMLCTVWNMTNWHASPINLYVFLHSQWLLPRDQFPLFPLFRGRRQHGMDAQRPGLIVLRSMELTCLDWRQSRLVCLVYYRICAQRNSTPCSRQVPTFLVFEDGKTTSVDSQT